jgi:hypothetical protein
MGEAEGEAGDSFASSEWLDSTPEQAAVSHMMLR